MSATTLQLYEMLGARPGASVLELKRAYRKQAAKQFHDRMSAEETERFKDVTEACETGFDVS